MKTFRLQAFSLTIKAELLFWSAERTDDLGTFAKQNSTSSFFFSAFESLGPSNIARQPIGSTEDQAAFKDKINSLGKRLEEIKQVCKEDPGELVKRHAVLELLLIPYSQLREFAELKVLFERDARRSKEE